MEDHEVLYMMDPIDAHGARQVRELGGKQGLGCGTGRTPSLSTVSGILKEFCGAGPCDLAHGGILNDHGTQKLSEFGCTERPHRVHEGPHLQLWPQVVHGAWSQ